MESRNKVIKIITVSSVILIFLLAVSLVINLVKLSNVKAKERELNAQLVALEQRLAENDEYISDLESDEYLDWIAREQLNMKGRDEDAFKAKD